RTDVGLRPHLAVPEIGEVVGFGAGGHADVLDLDEIADLGLLAEVRAGAQARVGSDFGAARHRRPLDVAEGADAGARGDLCAGAEDHVGLDGGPGPDLRVPGEVN